MIYLMKANHSDADKEWLFQRNIPADENGFTNEYHGISRRDFSSALDTMLSHSEGRMLPEGWVPQTVYYLWDEDNIVGTFHFRHHLCDSLIEGSGHIGYYIAPEFRGRGYARRGLALLIDEIKERIPEEEIYLRVNRDNPASLSVILANGGYIHHSDDKHHYVRIRK